MDAIAVTYFAMIVPVCLWLLAIVCWSVWWGMGRIRYLAWYGCGTFFGGVALGVQTLTPPFTYSLWAPWITPVYILTIVCLTQALSERLQVRLNRWWTWTVAIGIELLALYFSWFDENLSARLTVLAVGLTVLLLQLLPKLAQLPWRTQILEGLAGADLVGFQRETDASNFLRCLRRFTGYSTKGDVASPPAGNTPLARATPG